MSRVAARIVLDVLIALVVSVVLLGLWQGAMTGSVAEGFGQGIQLLFIFMDVGLVVWVVLLVIAAARRRPAGIRTTLLFAAVGAVTNLVVVIIVGIVQQGWAELFILFAIEAGIAFLVAAVISVLLVHRVIIKPQPAVVDAS